MRSMGAVKSPSPTAARQFRRDAEMDPRDAGATPRMRAIAGFRRIRTHNNFFDETGKTTGHMPSLPQKKRGGVWQAVASYRFVPAGTAWDRINFFLRAEKERKLTANNAKYGKWESIAPALTPARSRPAGRGRHGFSVGCRVALLRRFRTEDEEEDERQGRLRLGLRLRGRETRD